MGPTADRPVTMLASTLELIREPGGSTGEVGRQLGADFVFQGRCGWRYTAPVPPETGGADIQFLDGRRVVDEVYLEPIMELTKRHPERFTYESVMGRIGDYFAKRQLRRAFSEAVGDHLRVHGL